MSTPPPTQGPTPIPIDTWAAYNARILEIRNKFYDDQQALRATKDGAVKEAEATYATELAKLQVQYEADVASARAAFKPLS